MKFTKQNIIKSPLNYVGGKYKLLPQLLPLFPNDINRFIDLFAGGCNVGVNVKANHIICNDIESNVIGLMNYFKNHSSNEIIKQIEDIIHKYGFTETSKFGYEYYGCNSSDGVAKVNKEPYLKLREDYNNGKRSPIMFYTMLIFAFNNQIRFNDKGEFNMPVNKRDFNDKIRKNLIQFVDKLKEIKITFTNKDFSVINPNKLNEKDFVYCDPPYLITVAAYNERNGWSEEKEMRLLNLLDELNDNGIKFGLSNVLIHKGKRNEILINWSKKYNVIHINNTYKNSNYQTNKRNNKESLEVYICNYKIN